jgi:hypothetical protein
MWLVLIAELAVSATFIGLLVRALRRYDRHLARIESDFDGERDAVIANVRRQVDDAILELKAVPSPAVSRDAAAQPGTPTGEPAVTTVSFPIP